MKIQTRRRLLPVLLLLAGWLGTQAAGFRDFGIDLVNILDAEQRVDQQAQHIGVAVAEDGTVSQVAYDSEEARVVLEGTYWNSHGWVNTVATVAVDGPVQIDLGNCNYGNGTVTVKNADGETVATGTLAQGNGCWSTSNASNVVSVKYTGDATTLTISYGSYLPYIGVKAIEASAVSVSYAMGDAVCEGTALPAGGSYAAGDSYTLPLNRTLFKEGYTLTAWSDGENNYEPGTTIQLPANDLTLTPVFTENTVSLSDRTEAVTLAFPLSVTAGSPKFNLQGGNGQGFEVTQATIGGATIDVRMNIDATSGKFAYNKDEWTQVNEGTVISVPSCKGATIALTAYGAFGGSATVTTIDGQSDYTSATSISYTVASSAETVDIVFGNDAGYVTGNLTVTLPVVEQQGGGQTFENVEGTIFWAVGNEASGTVSDDIAPAISRASVSVGSGLTVGEANYFDTPMVIYTPNTSNAGCVEDVMIEYRVKAAAGVKFTPTKVEYAAVKVGTDNATYRWSYTMDGTESTITKIDPKPDLLRNNGANSSTAKLMHEENISAGDCNEFTFRFYISDTANNKNICIGKVTITGIVDGETVAVNMYNLTATAAPEEGGTVSIYPAGGTYEEGSEVTLTAIDNFGYDFVNWTNGEGVVVSTDAKFKYTVSADAELTANFEEVNTYELKLTVDGSNDYMVTVNPAPTDVEGKSMYEEGTTVQLTANSYEGLVTFNNWSDGNTESSRLVQMTDDLELTAFYAGADIIAGWDFYTEGANGRKADFAAQDNDGDALVLVNEDDGSTAGWLDKSTAKGGYESFKGAAVNWHAGSAEGDVGHYYWQTKVNAAAFTDINVQFQMLYNYNAYQTYDAEYSLDGETWTKFGSITMTGRKSPASFSETLPDECNNQAQLYIRMKPDKTSQIDGTASANDGNSLAMFFITGTPKLVDDGIAPVLVSTVPENGATGVSASGKVVLTFDERVKLASTAPTATLGELTLTPAVSGKTVTFEYKGLEYATDYTFSLPAGAIGDLTDNFLNDPITLTFTTMTRPAVEKGIYDAVVADADELLAALAAADARADKNVRFRIFLKNGTYTLPLSTTATINSDDGNTYASPITNVTSSNISFIGESLEGVVITNDLANAQTYAGTYGTTSVYDGISKSDVLQIQSNVTGTYFQDLTVKSGIGDALGRNIAVQDRGRYTIYKNTCLWGYQDTWTSNNDNGYYYFEGGKVRGRTDFLCGKGDAFFNAVDIQVCMATGGYIAVPSKSIQYGYVFKNCVINGESSQLNGKYTLGRPWGQGTPVALWIDTRMNIVPSAIGWSEMSNGWPKRFAEYNSTTSSGSVIDLAGRKTVFGDNHENNPVLTAAEAYEAGNLHNMFGEWDPTLLTEQAPVPANVTYDSAKGMLSWDNSSYVFCWAICKNGAVVDFTTDNQFEVDANEEDASVYSVRAANEMGGLSEASQAKAGTVSTDIVERAVTSSVVRTDYYNAAGQKISPRQGGIVFKVQTLADGQKVCVKVMK